MADKIDSIVKVVISIASAAVPQEGFGSMLVIDVHNRFEERVRLYAGTDGMSDDGFIETDAAYRAAQSYFAQDPPPEQIAIGRREREGVFIALEAVRNDYAYDITIKGVLVTYTSDSTATEAEIMAGISDAILAESSLTGVVTASATQLLDSTDTQVQVILAIVNADNDPLVLGIDKDDFSIRIPYMLNVDTVGAGTYKFVFGGEEISFVADGGDTYETISKGLVEAAEDAIAASPALTALEVLVVGVNWGTGLFLFLPIAGCSDPSVFVSSFSSNLDEYDEDMVLESIVEAYIAIKNVDNSWYGVMSTARDNTEIVALALKISSERKLHGYSSDDNDIVDVAVDSDTTTIAALLKLSNYFRTWGMYHDDADGQGGTAAEGADPFPEAALFGARLPVDLDNETATWKFAELVGIDTMNLTTGQINNAIGDPQAATGGKNINIYDRVLSLANVREGKVASGEFIDVIIGRDWLESRMTTDIYGVLKANLKVPYDAAGIALIVNQVHKRLSIALGTQFLRFDTLLGPNGYSITVPDDASISSATKATRVLSGIKFRASIAGAIHCVQITGTIAA